MDGSMKAGSMKPGSMKAGAMGRIRTAASALLAACLWSAVTPLSAAVDITGPEARAFLGGRTGKLVYLKNQLKQIYFIDLSDSVLTERKVADDNYCWSPMIHPDGSRIVYESDARIYIRNLEENSKERHLIYAGLLRGNHSLEPHWWINPTTKEEYIIFTNGDISDMEWPPQSGETFMQKIVANEPSGPLLTLLPFMMASGRSKNGAWGGTSHHSTGMYKLSPDKMEKAFVSSTNWIDSGGWSACNGSISPSDDPARQNRLMHLNSYLSAPDGIFENHKAVVMRSYEDKDLNSPIWYMGTPGLRCNNDGSGNLYWDHCEWSTDEGYFTVVGSKIIENWTEGDLYVARIDYGGNNQIRRFINGGGLNHYPHLWIKTGVAPAKIKLDKSLLRFASLKRDSSGPPPDTIKVSNGGDGVLPALKTDSLPGWIKVAIAANGTNAPLLIVTVDRTAAGLGDHSAKVKVSYGQSADSAVFTVTLRYSDPVLTTLKAARTETVLRPGDTASLIAWAFDQTGALLDPQPAIAWTALDALPVAADGKVKADSSVWTRHAFKGAAGSLACTTTVVIARILLRIDAGAAADSAPAGWIADGAFGQAGARETFPAGPVNLGAAIDPAPAAVYRTLRRPTGSMTLDSLPNGRYSLRFHFASPYPGTAAGIPSSGAAGMTVKLEGVALLEDYRLPTRPDSGVKVETRQLPVSVSDGDGLEIGFSGSAEAVAYAGVEIHDLGPLAISLLQPDGGESFQVGDTLHARWETDGFITSVGLQLSIDSGKTWIPVTRRSAINQGQAGWGDYPWVIPDSLDGRSLVTAQALLSVYDYFGTDRDRSNRVFAIKPSDQNAIRSKAASAASLDARFASGRLNLRLPQPGRYRVALFDVRNRSVLGAEAVSSGASGGAVSLNAAGIPRGVYRLLVTGAGLRISRSVTLLE
jgi:hypothetical protein